MKANSIIRKILIFEYNKEEIKSQVEIIYKDPNVLCMIPKSQMTSNIYGAGAKWCQRTKEGFDDWSNQGLLIRFLFKSGRKIRFTYYYERGTNVDYYWSSENGLHVLAGKGNPFEAKSAKPKARDMEKDILDHIALIPAECKDRVLKFIDRYIAHYEYCYSDNESQTFRAETSEKTVDNLNRTYEDTFIRFRKHKINFDISVDNKDRILISSPEGKEAFTSPTAATNRVQTLVYKYEQIISGNQ
jgi:hypothetical protein